MKWLFKSWAKRRQLFREVRGISLLDDVQNFFEKIAINRNREEKKERSFFKLYHLPPLFLSV